MGEDDIKPCNCLGPADWYYGDEGGFLIMCGDCLLETGVHDTLDSAIRDWNKEDV